MRTLALLPALALLLPAARAQTADLEAIFAKAARWDFDQDREPLRAVSDLIVKAHGDASQMREIEHRLMALLSPGGTLGSKDFACKELSAIGTDASVPALAKMLLDPKTSDMARYALERIPAPAANRALGDALPRSSGKVHLGMIHSLGRRGAAESVMWLRPLASGKDAAVAEAALFALAEIADPAALQILAGAQSKVAAEASLKAADRLVERGNTADAVPIYLKLYAPDMPPILRAGALRGFAAAGGSRSVPELVRALGGDDPRLQAVAVRALAQIAPRQLAAEMPRISEGGQVRVMAALAERDGRSALPVFTAALRSSSQPVRVAALEGLGRVGDASVISLLAQAAAGEEGAEKTAARASLVRIHGNDIDAALLAALSRAEPKAKLELVRATGERGMRSAAPVLLTLARDPDAGVRRASLRALRDTASADQISGLVEVVAKPVEAGNRAEAVRSLAAALRHSGPARIQPLLAAYKSAPDLETRSALMEAMGQSGNPQSLDILRAALADSNPDIQRAGILALTAWPNDVPAPDLIETARRASTPAHQVLALRGAVRLIGLPGSSRTPRETVKLLADIMSLARQPEEKRAVLGMLQRFPVPEALELAKASLGSDVDAEAKAAAARLERMLR